MKQFMLSRYSRDQWGNYVIWFGNRICVEYKSKRDMAAFLADTNRYLTQTMIELNEIYIQVFMEYRRTWFILQNSKSGKKVNLFDQERRIKSSLQAVDDMFERTGNTYTGTSDAVYSFVNLAKICGFMKDAC